MEQPLDAVRVASIIRSQFPDVAAASVEHLGEGYDSTAFTVDGQWVFRFPKRDAVEEQLLLEMRVLPVLARTSPIPLPQFAFYGNPSEEFPHYFVGYPRLPGVPAISLELDALRLARWAPALGRFLSWLHAYPLDDLMSLGVEQSPRDALIHEVSDAALEDLKNVQRIAQGAPMQRWRTFLSAPPHDPPERRNTVLVHRDLAAEHVLCDPASLTLTGVIDWSEIAIDDRAVDLAALYHWGGPAFVDAVLERYDWPVDAPTLGRARYFAACRGAADVTFGIERNRPEYVRAGLRALAWSIE